MYSEMMEQLQNNTAKSETPILQTIYMSIV